MSTIYLHLVAEINRVLHRKGQRADARRILKACLEAQLPCIEIDVEEHLALQKQIAFIWSIDDVLELRPDLDEEQAWTVLQAVRKHHDAEIGANWEILDCYAASLFPEPENEEGDHDDAA